MKKVIERYEIIVVENIEILEYKVNNLIRSGPCIWQPYGYLQIHPVTREFIQVMVRYKDE